MKILIALLLMCGVCFAEDKPFGMSDYDYGYAKGYKQGLEDYPIYGNKEIKKPCPHKSVENMKPKYRCLECGELVS